MPKIAYHHAEIQLSLFTWLEERARMTPTRPLKGYRVGPRLEVYPIWSEVRK